MYGDLEGFEDPWEHVRLLSDDTRNAPLFALLQRRAPGARVLEVGSGGGLLSVLAAKLGAKRVFAVEPTVRVEVTRALVEANRLQDVVEVIHGRIEDLPVQPVDLAFSELLNAEPFSEGVLWAMEAAARWVVPGGHLAPHRLRIWMALIRGDESHAEVARVRRTLARLEAAHGLDLGVLRDELYGLDAYRSFAGSVDLASDPVCLVDLALGTDDSPEVNESRVVAVRGDAPVAGAVVWFEAELDDGLVISNHPGQPGHWGHQVLGWPEAVVPRDGALEVNVCVDEEDGVDVLPL